QGDEEILALAEDAWSTGLTWAQDDLGEWDCLVLSPPGRYLWLRLGLSGSGKTTPAIRSVKVHFPRTSSIQYLPAVCGAPPREGTFLGRFLSVFDTVFGTVEGIVDRFPSYLDADSTPAKPLGGPGDRRPDFLTWLASWFGLVFEGGWDEARRRHVLR